MDNIIAFIFFAIFIVGFILIARRDNGSSWDPGRNSLDVGLMLVGWIALFFIVGAMLSR